MPKAAVYDHFQGFAIEKSVNRQLRIVAAKRCTTVAHVLREMVNEYLAQELAEA